MNIVLWCVVCAAAVARCAAEGWQFPEQAASVRIDTKVRFLDEPRHRGSNHEAGISAKADDTPFDEASEAEEFYERPAAGRPRNYHDGTLDSLQYCKCVSSPECNPSPDSRRACGAGKYLCCFKQKPNKIASQNTEYFNEIEDERPSLQPGRGPFARPFPPPPGAGVDGSFGPGHGHDAALLGAADRPVLTGPGGPTGIIGPAQPAEDARQPAVLVGPGGPTGVIGPGFDPHYKGDLTGPEALTDASPSAAAQRGVLVGPGGPTGIIGPAGYGQRPRLVGPGGPTGFIGPRMRGYLGRFFNEYMGRQAGPGVLVGPGGPTGVIGPAGRPILVGPGGPTGVIGPQY